MTSLVIPEEHFTGFMAIRDLPSEVVEEFISVLEDQPATLDRAELRSKVRSRVNSDVHVEVEAMMDTLISLYVLRDELDLSIEEFVGEVMEAMEESKAAALDLSGEKRRTFKERLPRLLSVRSLDVAARASNLLYEYEHTLHGDARVLTDMRPVFSPGSQGVEEQPRGAILVHTLKLSYHERRRVKEFFVTLDVDQVNQLIEALQRANSKATQLRVFLEGTDLPYIDVKGG
jgi:hypothetical protein